MNAIFFALMVISVSATDIPGCHRDPDALRTLDNWTKSRGMRFSDAINLDVPSFHDIAYYILTNHNTEEKWLVTLNGFNNPMGEKDIKLHLGYAYSLAKKSSIKLIDECNYNDVRAITKKSIEPKTVFLTHDILKQYTAKQYLQLYVSLGKNLIQMAKANTVFENIYIDPLILLRDGTPESAYIASYHNIYYEDDNEYKYDDPIHVHSNFLSQKDFRGGYPRIMYTVLLNSLENSSRFLKASKTSSIAAEVNKILDNQEYKNSLRKLVKAIKKLIDTSEKGSDESSSSSSSESKRAKTASTRGSTSK